MKTVAVFARITAAVLGVFLTGALSTASASSTLPPIGTDFGTYVVSGSHPNSNQGGTPYADTNFYLKGAMMISAPVDNIVGSTDYGMRTMMALFSFNTAGVKPAFDAQFGAGNWSITSIGIEMSSNYAAAGTQPNNPDFNKIAAGQFQLSLLGGNPDITEQTWNSLQAYLPGTTATPLGTFNWAATSDLNNSYQSYELSTTQTLVAAVLSGELSILGRAADDKVGYLFNTNTKGTPPALLISASALSGAAAPLLSLSTLSDHALTNNPTLNISGSVTDSAGIANLTINGATVPLNSDGSFSHPVQLAVGTNTITTVATSLSGARTSDIRTMTLDRTAPLLTFNQPADNSLIGASSVLVSGSVDDPLAVISAKVNNGQPSNAHLGGTGFSLTLGLTPGANTIEITATDQAGNVTSAKRSVTSDTTVPALAVTTPPQDCTTTQGSYEISGSVSGAEPGSVLSIAVDGQLYAPVLASDGSFTQTVTLSSNKTYAITVTATSPAAVSAAVQRNIIKSAAVPSGDVNGDGAVDVGDALRILRIAVGLDVATPEDYANGDVAPLVNGIPAPDGVIDIRDAVVTLRKAVKLVTW